MLEISEATRVKYLENRKVDLERCLKDVRLGAFETIEVVAHKMKGNGATFNFPEISAMGGDLEEAAQRRSPKDTVKTLEALLRFVTGQLDAG